MEKEIDIEIRDNFTNDALDKTPTWLMKWGVIAISIGITALLGLAAIIPYNQTTSFPVTVGNDQATYIVSNASGRVLVNNLTGAQKVNKGDTLLVISTPEQPDTYTISSITGFPVYSNKQVYNATQVETGDTLMKIIPIINPLGKIMAAGYINEQLPRNLLHSEQVSIRLAEATGNRVAVKGRLQYASAIPEAGKGYMVIITPDSNSLKELAKQVPLYHGMKAEASVILKQRSILQWIFD
ncbi:hypothetical protein FAM09_02225 [Niastella caeni]|uniref:HlyD family efflux transporter periplasmic adaptor subunit n=1 Tax=Niastella caeni TaxID=2569763 RepID=A0A4S8I2P0_9BACT|nr:hypothetical protein [Niastella caeni]THU40954.1 hypothetical protein FAM09_02225 [Niastella caeni]